MHTAPQGSTQTGLDSIAKLPLSEVARRCGEAASRYERGRANPGDEYCFEMFRRAICDRDERAWDAVFAQYHGLVLANVRRQPWPVVRGDDDEAWVNGAFARFWHAVRPERFAMFADLPA